MALAALKGDKTFMRRIDELHLNHPFAGFRMPRDLRRQESIQVGRRHVATLMKKLDIEAQYRRPNTRRKHPRNPVFPSLLRGPEITRPNHGWAIDITYVPMRKGLVVSQSELAQWKGGWCRVRASVCQPMEFR